MFSSVDGDFLSGPSSTYFFDISFSHIVADFNTFANFRGFFCAPINFNLLETNPVTNDIKGTLFSAYKDIYMTMIAF